MTMRRTQTMALFKRLTKSTSVSNHLQCHHVLPWRRNVHFPSSLASISSSTVKTSSTCNLDKIKPGMRTACASTSTRAADHDPPPPSFNPTWTSCPDPRFTSVLTVADSDVRIHLNQSLSYIGISSPLSGIPHTEPYQIDHWWLRDACMSIGENDGNQVPSIHKSTRQKLFHTADIAAVDVAGGQSLLDWSDPPRITLSSDKVPQLTLSFSTSYPVLNSFSSLFSTQIYKPTRPHITNLPISFLLIHSSSELYKDFHSDVFGIPEPWKSRDMKMPQQQVEKYDRPIRLDWRKDLGGTSDVQESEARIKIKSVDQLDPNTQGDLEILKNRFEITSGLLRDGLVFVKGLDNERTGSEMGKDGSGNVARLKDLAEIFGEIRSTFYGSLWDVRSLSESKNIAYTNLDLGLHMDLLYFQSPPRFQFLHVLKSKVDGGESIFVDSFAIAEQMWRQERDLWTILTQVKVGYWYRNDGKFYRFNHKVLEIDEHHEEMQSDGITNGNASGIGTGIGEEKMEKMPRLKAVNYSPPFQSPLPLIASSKELTAEKRDLFFKAFQRFTELSHEREFRYERKLDEKECVIFDNRRVLHARRGFEWHREDENPNRDQDQDQRKGIRNGGNENGIHGRDGNGDGHAGKVKRWLKGCYVDGDAIWSSHRVLRQKLSRGESTK